MKAVILAGGYGTRFSEETHLRPKPMIEIGGYPVLWHIMKNFSEQGITDFVICLGYKGYVIKEFFANYVSHVSDLRVDLKNDKIEVLARHKEPWTITLVDTGVDTMTGGRLKRVAKYLGKEDFCFTYGDGLSNIDIKKLLAFHQKHQKLATVTAVQTPGRFGVMQIEKELVTSFVEKPDNVGFGINGGFFILSPRVIDYIHHDQTVWEKEPLETLSREGELCAYQHKGFWAAMDAQRDKKHLEDLWCSGKAPWKLWRDET